MEPLSLLLKPAADNCQLNCQYCFYESAAQESQTAKLMDTELLEQIVKKALQYARGSCTFIFQGGEPTLVGLKFYKRLVELQEKYNQNNLEIKNTIQTNGLKIDQGWAQFLAENDFLVGISIDGYKSLHNQNRTDQAGRGSYEPAMEAINLFNEYNVEYNILSVVTSQLAKQAKEVYSFYREQEFKHLQFIPCLPPKDESCQPEPYALKPKLYAKFLTEIFDEWYKDIKSDNIISIRYFENLVGIIMGYQPVACDMRQNCSSQYVIETDGSIYPCDFYVREEWKLGNIKTSNFNKLSKSKTKEQFISESIPVATECKKCKWFKLCRGGCKRNRKPPLDKSPKPSYFCSSYKEFFSHANEKIKEIARIIAQKH